MIHTGTTCFDQCFWAEGIMPVVRPSGLHTALTCGIAHLGEEAARWRELARAEAVLCEVQGSVLMCGWMGPHAFFVDRSRRRCSRSCSSTGATGLGYTCTPPQAVKRIVLPAGSPWCSRACWPWLPTPSLLLSRPRPACSAAPARRCCVPRGARASTRLLHRQRGQRQQL